jgi:formyltetrahydrofolate deformylase
VHGRLLITCPDRHGIVAAVAGFLAASGANIVSSDQHSTDPEAGAFFMRMEFNLEHGDLRALGRAFAQEVADRLDMQWRLADAGRPKRMAILVSREDHCLVDLLWRHRRGELDAVIPLVASNHPDHAVDVASFGIPYHHVPYPNEPELLELLRGVDLVVLARYMRILSPEFVARFPNRIINIHPSLLPYHPGANAYKQAFEAGVRVSGCTAHFVTEQLDEGPVILQDVFQIRVGEDTLEDVKEHGKALEGKVLSQAVQLFLNEQLVVTDTKVLFRPGRLPA